MYHYNSPEYLKNRLRKNNLSNWQVEFLIKIFLLMLKIYLFKKL